MQWSRTTPHLALTALLTLPLSCTADIDEDDNTATDAQGCRSIAIPQSEASDSDAGSTTETGSASSSTSTTASSSSPTTTEPTTEPTTMTEPTTTVDTTTTSSTTEPEPMCGNARVEGDEECDDGEESATCDADCTAVSCGDGTLNKTAGEVCDDGGESETCNADCTTASCGDGKLNTTAGEVCDDGNADNGDGCSSSCEYEPSRVFVTSKEAYKGDLSDNMMQDPLDYADAQCQELADQAQPQLNGEFMAWLSDGTVGAYERLMIPESFDKGIVLAATGEPVADSWEALLVEQPTLLHAIDTDEQGTVYMPGAYAWTHTKSDGTTADGVPCPKDPGAPSPWTSGLAIPKAFMGDVTATNKSWTQSASPACSNTLRLYCFEVPPPSNPAP